MARAHRLDERGAGERAGACAVHHHAAIAQFAAGKVAGVDEPGGGDDRGAVLIVVHHRDVHAFAQRRLDDEAFGRGDVFEIDAAEGRLHQRHRLDELVGILGVEFDIDRIDVGEPLEQHRLAFHHRLGRERAEIAHAQDRGPVGDYGDKVRARGVSGSVGRIVGDGLDRGGDTGRIGEA